MLQVNQLNGFNDSGRGIPATLLMLHGDGSDASTTITDSGPLTKTCTASGNAQIDTAFKQYGTGSIMFDGTGDYVTVTASANDFNLGSGDFTVEFWVRRNGDAASGAVGGIISFGGSAFKIVFSGAGTTMRVENLNGSYDMGTAVPDTTWTHCALTRENGKVTFWQGGVKLLSWTAYDLITNSGNLSIGSAEVPGSSGNQLAGWIDDLRVVKGVAMYSATFTPPAAALPNSP